MEAGLLKKILDRRLADAAANPPAPGPAKKSWDEREIGGARTIGNLDKVVDLAEKSFDDGGNVAERLRLEQDEGATFTPEYWARVAALEEWTKLANAEKLKALKRK